MIKSIEKLIELMNDGTVTAYQVYKNTGVSQHQLSQLKQGKIKIENLSIATGIKLENYYKGEFKMIK